MEAVADDEELLREAVEAFLEDTPGDLVRLQHLLTAGDWPAAERAAHGLKGGAGTVGAARLRALAQAVEQAAHAADAARCAALAPQLDAALAAFEAAARAALWPG